MSKSEWESGTLKIPSAAWKPLRDGLAKAYNEQQTRLFNLALKLHPLLLEWKKAQPRGKFRVSEGVFAVLQEPRYRLVAKEFDELHACQWSLAKSLTGLAPDGKTLEPSKLRMPRKMDYPAAVSTKTNHYRVEEAGISLDHEKKTLHWSVSENNHAVERARESFMGSTMFRLLGKIEWTRGSGGEFAGNDEYNQDNRESGGGANYVTQRYAHKTKAEKEAEARSRVATSRMGHSYGYGGWFQGPRSGFGRHR